MWKRFDCTTANWCYCWFPCIDFKATLYDGAYHDVDFSVLAFVPAARAAFRRDYKAKPVLLEPMMKVEVVTLRVIWVML